MGEEGLPERRHGACPQAAAWPKLAPLRTRADHPHHHHAATRQLQARRAFKQAALLAVALLALLVVQRRAPQLLGNASSRPGNAADAADALPPPPPLSAAAARHPDAAELCSAVYRQRNAAAVQDGAAPAVLRLSGCDGIRDCDAAAAQRLVDSYRQRQLQDLLQFVPCDLFRLLQGRTLWMLGDSQVARWYRVLRCFMAPLAERREDRQSRTDEPITDDPQLLQQIDEKLLAGFKGDQWGNVWHDMVAPMCTHLAGGTRICHGKVHLAQQLVDRYLPNLALLNASRSDVLVTNVGLWHHPAERNEYRQLMRRLADHFAAQRERLPHVIWRETSLQHFMLPSGEYPDPGRVEELLRENRTKCAPLEGALLLWDGTLWGSNAAVLAGGWRNSLASPLLADAGVPILPAWNESLPMHELHEPGECTHFCTPGGYDVWTWQLWRLLRGTQLRPIEAPPPHSSEAG